MTERKPPSMTFESWVDKQVREAAERGEFDDLPGAGKPLPGLHDPHHEMRWIKQKIEREGLSSEALLPTSVQLRKEIDRLPEAVRDLPSEQAVRDAVRDLNRRIAEALRAPADGLRLRIGPVDVDDVVHQWQQDRRPPAPDPSQRTEPAATGRSRWWHRLLPRRIS